MIYSLLFSPGNIGTLETKNRVVMPPMVRNYADERGLVTPRYVAHIERVARGGVGTIIPEASFIRQDGKGFANELGLHTDDVIPGLKQLVQGLILRELLSDRSSTMREDRHHPGPQACSRSLHRLFLIQQLTRCPEHSMSKRFEMS